MAKNWTSVKQWLSRNGVEITERGAAGTQNIQYDLVRKNSFGNDFAYTLNSKISETPADQGRWIPEEDLAKAGYRLGIDASDVLGRDWQTRYPAGEGDRPNVPSRGQDDDRDRDGERDRDRKGEETGEGEVG